VIGKLFTYPILIKENHLDTFGHVNNATYLALFEEARWDLITQNGYGLKKIQETGIGPTILEIKINFLKEVRLREEVIIETQITSYEKKIAKLQHTMRRGDDICCQAEIIIALFDLRERKLILPTAEWLRAIGLS
jgi:thioesterase-3